MIDISVKDLVKSYDVDENLLDGLTFDVNKGERVAILGRNGAGKTTLFRILTGEIGYDSGEIRIAAGRRMGLISQIPNYPEAYTVEDVLRTAFRELEALRRKLQALEAQMTGDDSPALLRQYDELSARFTAGGGYETDVETDKTCNGLGIPADMRARRFSELSGGEKTRVNLARLLLEKTDILLLDEPTNHLDLKSVEWLEAYLLRFKGTVLTISHDRYFLDRVVQRVIELRGGKAEFYSGNYSFYVQEKEARYQLQLRQYEQEQAKLKQLGYTLERMKGWGINNRTLYRRAMSIQHRMERIEKTERPTKERTLSVRFAEKEFHGDEVLSIRGLSKKFGDRTLFSDVELLVEGGQRIAFLGDNGTGKSTFLKILLGEEAPTAGRLRFGPSVRTAYLPQIIRFAHPERSLLDTMLYEKNCSTQEARDRLGAFLFQGEDVFKPVASLSGGEQSRLRLCMLMDEKINFLILDEPTNHLDIASREWIEAALDDYEGTLLFVSHDRYFVDRFATRVWELREEKIFDYPFGYEKYRAIRERELQQAPPPAAPVKEKKPPRVRTPGGTKELEKQVARLEREIEKQEAAVAACDEAIAASASDYQALAAAMAEKEQAEAVLADLYGRWEAASEELEARSWGGGCGPAPRCWLWAWPSAFCRGTRCSPA